MIAHDLRSPLMNIMGVVEVMTEGMFGSVTEEQKKWLARIEANSQNLVDLVSDFLDVSKLESGYVDVNREMVNLTGLIQKSIDSYRVLALDKRISIKGAVDPSLPAVHADPRRLDQVLSNLISNAIKFTEEGGTVEVGAALTDATLIQVWVRDNGVGIAADEMGQLFEKYRQGGNVKHSSHKGTGLGLVICKMIVEAHSGQIWVESAEGSGATFFFSLPTNG
jgi:signal transduction histidine kinase